MQHICTPEFVCLKRDCEYNKKTFCNICQHSHVTLNYLKIEELKAFFVQSNSLFTENPDNSSGNQMNIEENKN